MNSSWTAQWPVSRIKTAAVRSLLFAPADSEKKMDKARLSGAEAVIFDLEDSIPPSGKLVARQMMLTKLQEPRLCLHIVRVNDRETPWYLDDVVAACAGAADAIMLPKCAGPAVLQSLADQLDVLEVCHRLAKDHIQIIPLVTETAASLQSLDYRGHSRRLLALGFAGEDLAADLGVHSRGKAGMNPLLEQARIQVAMAAASAGVPAIDTPFPDPADESGLLAEVESAVALGFSGKMCIHPAQLAIVNEAFSPPEADIIWANEVLAAVGQLSDSGVAVLHGKMIDRAHVRMAERIVARAVT